MSTLNAAQKYVRRGFAVVPIPAGRKRPILDEWEKLRLGDEDLPHHFNGKPQNIGLILGEPSGGLVDVDLDVPEARRIAGRFLEPTLTSGRGGNPHSHWWYVAPGTTTAKFKDADEMVVELRSTGLQTLVAPSEHPSGERYVWHSESGLDIAEVDAADLARRVQELATATLIARHVPAIGGRHDFAMSVAGFLLRLGRLDEETVLKIMHAAWHAAGADSREALRDTEGIVRDTAARIETGERVVGGPTLEASTPGVVGLLCKWWGWRREEQGESHREEKEDRRNQADRLIGYALDDVDDLFVDQHGAPHALVGVEPVPLTSRCYSLLRRTMWEREERAVNG